MVPRKKLEGRIRQFQEGDWITLLNDSATCAAQAAGGGTVLTRPHGCPRHVVGASWRIVGRQASSALAPGNVAILRDLTDPAKRPLLPREEVERRGGSC